MNFTDEQQMLYEMVHDFAENEIKPIAAEIRARVGQAQQGHVKSIHSIIPVCIAGDTDIDFDFVSSFVGCACVDCEAKAQGGFSAGQFGGAIPLRRVAIRSRRAGIAERDEGSGNLFPVIR